MSRGMISMGIALAANLSSLHHATTLWGYEVDNATGLVTKVWITDSDDMDRDPKVPVLHEYTVSVSGSRTIKLSGEPYGACYVVTLVAVSGYDRQLGDYFLLNLRLSVMLIISLSSCSVFKSTYPSIPSTMPRLLYCQMVCSRLSSSEGVGLNLYAP